MCTTLDKDGKVSEVNVALSPFKKNNILVHVIFE